MSTVIETDGLTKRFGSGDDAVLAVEDLDLTVEEGEIFGFLGPNGAGKSTTINMLLDFVRPTDGSARVLGMDAQTSPKRIRERVGMLPEGASLYDRLTGREHLEWVIDTKDADATPGEMLRTVGLDGDDADRKAGGYSKGMQQRLGLGMALVGDPDLLILDEPSSGLDPNGIQRMRELLRDRADAGTTVFFSSHILGEVEAVCDRIGIMNEGQLAAVDTIEGLREEAGGTATVEIEVAGAPDVPPVTDLDGVVDATVEDATITAVCEDASVKVDAIKHVDRHAEVVDVLSQDTSLEELFNAYTGEGGTNGTADGAADPERTEVTA